VNGTQYESRIIVLYWLGSAIGQLVDTLFYSYWCNVLAMHGFWNLEQVVIND